MITYVNQCCKAKMRIFICSRIVNVAEIFSTRMHKPPRIYYHLLNIGTKIRQVYLRCLSLPRIRKIQLLPKLSPSGRLQLRKYRIQPWYVQPTLKNRWGISAWMIWLRGGALPGDQNGKYQPEGFLSREVGPVTFQGKGLDEMTKNQQQLLYSRREGSSFSPS